MKYTVDGETLIKWSCLVEAENEEEAENKAQDYWQHNTTAEIIHIDGVWEGDLNG